MGPGRVYRESLWSKTTRLSEEERRGRKKGNESKGRVKANALLFLLAVELTAVDPQAPRRR